MVSLLSLLGLSFASVVLLIREVRNAPEGYEDHSGFHLDDVTQINFRTAETPRAAKFVQKNGGVIVKKRAAKDEPALSSLTFPA